LRMHGGEHCISYDAARRATACGAEGCRRD
jgi:hypothetical protein